jgi:putative hydrolase of the HAD superfamily
MKVLLFDLDDTLVPSSRSYDQALKFAGISPDDERFLEARADVKRRLPKGYPAARSRRLYFKRFLELGDDYTPKRHLELASTYENEVARILSEAWSSLNRPALFEKLRKNADVIGIVSNETANMQSLKLAGMDPNWKYFDFIVTSEEVGVEKPDSRMFSRALELAAAKAADCTFIGDSYEMDIVPTTALGMRTIQTLEFLQTEKRHSATIAKLNELATLLSL